MNKLIFFSFLSILIFNFILSIRPVRPSDSKSVPDICKQNCSSQYGIELGISGNVIAFSNCGGMCFNNDTVILDKADTGLNKDLFTGLRWQCVQYARRWLIINLDVTFESIDYAFHIFDLETVADVVKDGVEYQFKSFPNGNKHPPQVGDLIISPRTEEIRTGHVAVVAGVNLEEGYVDLAEQNNENAHWRDPNSHARRVILLKQDDKYILTDMHIENNYLMSEHELVERD